MLRAVDFHRHVLLGGFPERPARAWGSETPEPFAVGARLGQGEVGALPASAATRPLVPQRIGSTISVTSVRLIARMYNGKARSSRSTA
jgi:hypothetical protein